MLLKEWYDLKVDQTNNIYIYRTKCRVQLTIVTTYLMYVRNGFNNRQSLKKGTPMHRYVLQVRSGKIKNVLNNFSWLLPPILAIWLNNFISRNIFDGTYKKKKKMTHTQRVYYYQRAYLILYPGGMETRENCRNRAILYSSITYYVVQSRSLYLSTEPTVIIINLYRNITTSLYTRA